MQILPATGFPSSEEDAQEATIFPFIQRHDSQMSKILMT